MSTPPDDATIDREDNPIISCTEKELAWATWQIARGRIDRALGDMTLTFMRWWKSIVDAQPVISTPARP